MCTETGLCQRCIKVIKIKIESSVITSGTWVGPVDTVNGMNRFAEGNEIATGIQTPSEVSTRSGDVDLGASRVMMMKNMYSRFKFKFSQEFSNHFKKSVSISWNQITRIFS